MSSPQHLALCGKHFSSRTRANCHCNNLSRTQDETLSPNKVPVGKGRDKRSVFLTLWPDRFGLGHVCPTAEKKMMCKNSSVSVLSWMVLNTLQDMATEKHFAKGAIIEPVLVKGYGKIVIRPRSLDVVLRVITSALHFFLITQEDKKLI